MPNLTELFTIAEVTRNMPQYGYALSGIPQDELSNLAEHHYLCTFIAWQLTRTINKQGGNLNVQRTLEYALIHDFAELLGGDINFYYGRHNQDARQNAKAFEHTNSEHISKLFGKDQQHYQELFKEFEEGSTDEALVARSADLIECLHYKLLKNKISENDLSTTITQLTEYADKCQNVQNGFILKKIVLEWADTFGKKSPLEILTNS